MRTLRTILAVIVTCVWAMVGAQQSTLSQQNERRRRAEKRLEEIRSLIGKNTLDATKSQRALLLTRNGIEVKRSLVAGLDGDIASISHEIGDLTRQTDQLDASLARLKKDYGASVRAAWINHRMGTATAFLLSAHDFNDATRRVSHLNRYNRARATKGAEIDSLGSVLKAKTHQLTERKSTLARTKALRKSELASLTIEEGRYNRALGDLAKDRKKLDAQEKKERAEYAAAQRAIDAIMAQQTKAAKGKSSPIDVVLSGKFEQNKGRLPWPVEGRHAVLDHFGVKRTADGIEKNLKGITIATRPGATIKAVFDGTVTGIYNIAQFGKCVLVRSGSYVTLYGNLGATDLRGGAKVTLGQRVGTIADDDNTAHHMLIFQIWRENVGLDPEQWLR